MTDITLPLRLHMYMYIYLYIMYWWTQLAAHTCTCTYSRSKTHNRTVNDSWWRHLVVKVRHRDTAYNWTPDMHNSPL